MYTKTCRVSEFNQLRLEESEIDQQRALVLCFSDFAQVFEGTIH